MSADSNQEIEIKYLISQLPFSLADFPCHEIEQSYLCKDPVVRIRQEDETCYLTYKSKGHLARTEYNLPLTTEAYLHLKEKSDGVSIHKTRYLIPYLSYTIELDVFHGIHQGLVLAEVEFSSLGEVETFPLPQWFHQDVTYDPAFKNSSLSDPASLAVTLKSLHCTDTAS